MSAKNDWKEEAGELVRKLGPIPKPIAEAMGRVPRHLFVPPEFRTEAYEDEPLPLPYGEATISAPHMVALQLEWSELRPGFSVLEVGSGSGYLCALIAELVRPQGRVLGLELLPGLADLARETLRSLGYAEVEIRSGDGRPGAPDRAPFDRILVSCACPEIESEWKHQVREGGTVVAPVGGRYEQTLLRYRRHGDSGEVEEGPACRFVPLQRRFRRAI